MSAGNFPLTVMVRKRSWSDADDLGHADPTYIDVRKCAARQWERSTTERAADPAAFGVGAMRLLLYLPPTDIDIGWHIVHAGKTWRINDMDWRAQNQELLVTLQMDDAS